MRRAILIAAILVGLGAHVPDADAGWSPSRLREGLGEGRSARGANIPSPRPPPACGRGTDAPDAGTTRTQEPAAPDAGTLEPDRDAELLPRAPSEPPSPPPPGVLWRSARDLLSGLLPFAELASLKILGLLILLIAGSLLGARLVHRARARLAPTGILPRLLWLSGLAFQALAIVFFLALLVRSAPAWMGPALPWMLLALAAAIGWSARDIIPDLIAGLVMLIERRVRSGAWVSTGGYSGTIDHVGLRAVWLRDADGRLIAVPNRVVLGSPVLWERGPWPTCEVTVRFPEEISSERVRRALLDAAITSPWTPVGAEPVLGRDGDDPSRWHVRVRVLDVRFARRLEGDLLERAEDVLRAEGTGRRPDASRPPKQR